MALTLLRLTDFRNFLSAEIAPCHQGLNIIHGDNGSGKTSLLEAIHFLSLGSSFRSTSSSPLIRQTTTKLSLFAKFLQDNDNLVPIGVEKESHGAMRMRVNEEDVASWADMANFLPTRVINSQSHQLFEAGPHFRRKFLDWGLFYTYSEFLPCWRHYNRALKQRNTILKDKRSSPELAAWSAELVKYGVELDRLRREYISHLIPTLAEILPQLLELPDLQVNYHPGWDAELSYAEVLTANCYEEYRMGYTQAGPHRADLDITIDAIPIKHFLSRGQQKLLVCAMILAQGGMLAKQANKRVIYLVDDLPSELDTQSRQKIVSLLAKEKAQVFITAIERHMISDLVCEKWSTSTKLFHVEHGRVVENA